MTVKKPVAWTFIAFASLVVGCASPSVREPVASLPAAVRATVPTPVSTEPRPTVTLVAATADEPKPAPKPLPAPPSGTTPSNPTPPSGTAELTAEAVVDQVLARNPTLAQMVAAWQAAAARYPQVTSLDDPVLGSTVAPAAVGQLGDGNRGYALTVSQKVPWPGKLALRGESARAEADAAGRDVEDTRQQLIEAARVAFYEYYLVGRALDVNVESLRLLKEFRANAEARYKTGTAPQQDILQADVEIGRQRERQLKLERTREVAIARINTLSHQPPTAPLPPPPKDLRPKGLIPDAESLQAAAFSRRPDLQAVASRTRAGQAAVALANKEYYPDFRATAGYATFMDAKALYPQVGLEMNIPLRISRRDGAVAEAQARLAQRREEFSRLRDQINFQVQDAVARVRESERAVKLYEAEILPAAEANVKSAQTAYVTGKLPFLSLIEAQRNVVGLRDRNYEVIAEYFRRLALLERAVGGPVAVTAVLPSLANDK